MIDRVPVPELIANSGRGRNNIQVAYTGKREMWVTSSFGAVVEPITILLPHACWLWPLRTTEQELWTRG
ncbi:MAG: hypothetical protein LUF04_08295 [Bacteroides sp.]|nr:hypothetical protein [Bacteroides sp.]